MRTYQSEKPIILNPTNKQDWVLIRRLRKKSCVRIIDDFVEQVRELFLSRNPDLKMDPRRAYRLSQDLIKKSARSLEKTGNWIYFDWDQTLVHVLSKREYGELRTARNRNLISKSEQDSFRDFKVGIIGLSVGNSIALCIALEGGCQSMRLADHDNIALSNLNRIRGGARDLGLNKAVATARQIYELNPYANLEVWKNGVAEEELSRFLGGLNVVIDEMDDVILKLRLREEARKMKIPVISAADNGDNAVVDVERFDQEPERKIYHGLLGRVDFDHLRKATFQEQFDLINKMVGVQYVTSRMKKSLLLVGKKLYAWPQLGGAAFLSGSALTYVVRRMATGEDIPSGKYDVNLDRIFERNFDSPKRIKARRNETKRFLESFRMKK